MLATITLIHASIYDVIYPTNIAEIERTLQITDSLASGRFGSIPEVLYRP